MRPAPKEVWQYLGPEGKGLLHLVLHVCGTEVVTWGEPLPDAGGYSWLGPISEFLKYFKRAK